jgi:transposase
VLPIETWTRFKLIHEPEWTGMSVSDICSKYGVSRKTFYKWKNRYSKNGMEGLKNLSRKPYSGKSKVTKEYEETILDLRLNKRFGPNRVRFRLNRLGISLSSRTIYKILKRHGLNVLKCRIKRKYRRFAMKHPNDMVQIDIMGPFYMRESRIKNYMINCIDDCSRKVVSIWSGRKRAKDVLNVLEEWIRTNGKPKKVMHDNGRQFKSKPECARLFGTYPEHVYVNSSWAYNYCSSCNVYQVCECVICCARKQGAEKQQRVQCSVWQRLWIRSYVLRRQPDTDD